MWLIMLVRVFIVVIIYAIEKGKMKLDKKKEEISFLK